jgi:serine/threonine protein kinase
MPELVRTVGRYGVVRELGRGGMAVVYLARQLDLDRLVALKELAAFHAADPAFAQRFVRESRLAGSLVHPNVITVFDYFEHEGTPYIAMEYVERGSLRPYVGRMTPAQIGGVLEGLLAGLAAAEERTIVHRDLKPENLMVTSAGGVKIADFGIAKATQAADTGAFVTTTGMTVGTPPYMAPEQAMARDIGPWTDLYSVGCMAYELFTGKPPFHDTGEPMAILLRHITEALPPACDVADVDTDISDWIERLVAKTPGDRPPSALVAWEALEEIMIGKLGPRWRREARLPEPPSRGGSSSLPTPSVPGPATPPPPSGPAPVMEGIDMEGTGPDTPESLSAAETPAPAAADDSEYQTYLPPPASLPPVEASPPPEPAAPTPPAATPPPAAPPPPTPPATAPPAPAAMPTPTPTPAPAVLPPAPVAPRVVLLARAGAVALLAGVVIPLLATGPDRWNLFAVLSPFEAGGVALATWIVARALSTARVPVPFAAGVLVGIGVLMSIAGLGLIKFTVERLDAPSTVLTLVVLLGAAATLAAGVGCLRSASPSTAAAPADPAPLVLGLAGVALASVALFVNYDGFSSLWSEVPERESAEFFFEPAVAAAAMLVGLLMMGARPRVASGLLLALGGATALHFLGLIVAAWRAIGEIGEVRAAGFIGVLGGLLVLAAGAWVYRAQIADRDPRAVGAQPQ